MKLCYCGPRAREVARADRCEFTSDGAHGCNSIGHELCDAWNSLGYEASIWNYWKTTEDGIKTNQYYDAVFLYDHSMAPLWADQVPDWDWHGKLTIYYSQLPPSQDKWSRKCHLVGYIHSSMEAEAREVLGTFRPGVQLFSLPWGAPASWVLPPELPDPYTHERRVAVWAGRLHLGNVGPLEAVCKAIPDIELHIFSNSLVAKHLREDQLPRGKHVHFHGAAKHGTFYHYLWYADVALDAMISRNQKLVNCKQADYVLAGVPVVAEGPVPGDQYLRATGNGIIVPYNRTDYEAYVRAVASVLSRDDWPRRAATAYMLGCHTWAHRAYTVHQQIALWKSRRSASKSLVAH